MKNIIPTKSFLVAFIPGLLVGIFILSLSPKILSFDFFNNRSDTKESRGAYVAADRPGFITTGNKIPSTNQNELTQRLEKYSHYSPEEIENELVSINKALISGSSENDNSLLIISLYYLANKWAQTSPVEALNFKKTKGIHSLIFYYWHDGLNSHIWDLMVEAGKISPENNGNKK